MIFNDYEVTLEAAKTACQHTAEKLNANICFDEAVFRECFESAETSCGFHGDSGVVNHIRQVGHLIFWILKLKPYVISASLLHSLSDLLQHRVAEMLDSEYKDEIKKAREIFVNESIAILLTIHLVEKGYDDIRGKLSPEDGKILDEKIGVNVERYVRYSSDLLNSYREHNYTARGMATMFNLAFSTGYESRKE